MKNRTVNLVLFGVKWALFYLLCPGFSLAGNLPPGFAEVLVASQLDPTGMALAPDGRLFLIEKSGNVLIVENGILNPDPFLQIEVDNYNERGLSGIAIDPDFAQNGYFYLYYTVKNANHNRLSRFTAQGDFVLPGSEVILLELDQLFGSIHNGGAMVFGPDGKLYVSVGDGSNAETAQQLGSLHGKILRLNADGSIPSDNPFYNQTNGKYRSIYALGFRNSFSMAIQPGTGLLFACDVGGGDFEEVNEIFAGRNYGWPIVEGYLTNQNPPNNYQNPLYAYDHGQGCSIIGAAFYNPQTPLFPNNYAGKFFFADYCQGYIKVLNPNSGVIESTFATNVNRPLSLLVAPDGTLYYLARAGIGGGSIEDNTTTSAGTLWRVFYTGNGAPFVSVNPVGMLVSQGENATFFMAASGVEPLTYQWERNGAAISGATTPTFIFENAMLPDSGSLFQCIVTNAFGADTTLPAMLRVTSSQRPEPQILTPAAGTTYRAGDILSFTGSAFDPEQGILPLTSLRWKIDFHHNTHSHPGLPPTTGISGGEFVIPKTGEVSEDVWYRIYLTATDSSGLSKTVIREVLPVKTQFVVKTEPKDFFVTIDGNFQWTPATVNSVVGIIRSVVAPLSQIVGDTLWAFKQWTNGQTTHELVLDASDDTLNFTALYEPFPLGQGTGLRGFYFNSPPSNEPIFIEPYQFSRIDTVVNFDWGGGSPDAQLLGDDFWLVRWQGFLRPVFEGWHNFHVVADDGIRLWVNNQLIIDQWIPQPPTEATGSILLQGDTQVPIKLEFFEEAGGAVCQLLWSSDRLSKGLIPKRQLYPEIGSAQVNLEGLKLKVFPNPFNKMLRIEAQGITQKALNLSMFNSIGQPVHTSSLTAGFGTSKWEIPTGHLANGIYWLKISDATGKSTVLKIVKD